MTTQTANTEGLEDLVKYVRENQKPIAYTSAIALAVGVLDQFVLGNRGLDNVGLDVLATYGAYCGLTKKVANPIPAIVAYLTAKLGYEPIITPKLAGLDSLLGGAFALVGTAGLARGLRYAKDNWDEKTKPALKATGKAIGKGAAYAGKKTWTGAKATGKGLAYVAKNTSNGLSWPVRKAWNRTKLNPPKTSQDPNVQDIDQTLN